MLRYCIQRSLQAVPTLILISFLVFMLTHLIPGDPVATMLGYTAEGMASGAYSQESYDEMKKKLGFDKPIHVQYITWLGNVLRGEWGDSFVSGMKVTEVIKARLPTSGALALASFVFSIIIAVPIAILSATRQNTWVDYFSRVFSLLGVCVPSFWLALLLILFFCIFLGWLPALGYTAPQENFVMFLKHISLPMTVLAIHTAAKVTRFMRSDVIEQLHQDYVRTARAKGMTRRWVLWRHVLKNSFITTTTVLAFEIGHLLGGSTVIESVFAWPGISYLMLQSIYARDYPVVQGAVMVMAVAVITVNFLVDVLYHYLDPRIKLQ